MSFTSRRKRRLDRERYQRDAYLIVIATEGTHTEYQYFQIFRNPRIKVVVLPTENVEGVAGQGHSSPKHVIKRLDRYRKENVPWPNDEMWIMFDRDRWTQEMLTTVCQLANQKNYSMAISNPCFELWLLLHHMDVERDAVFACNDLVLELRNLLGEYNKDNVKLENFEGGINQAIIRAEAKDIHPADRWPQTTGTHVYRVVKTILDANPG